MRSLLYFMLLSMSSVSAIADSMRCGKWVVNEETAPSELAQKCGEPNDKKITKEDVFGRNALGNPIKLGIKTTERWLYQPSTRSLPMVVTIVDGKVKAIERVE